MDQSPPPKLMMLVLLLHMSTSSGYLSGNSAVTGGSSTLGLFASHTRKVLWGKKHEGSIRVHSKADGPAVVHDLHCVNDFVSTISCTLSFAPPGNTTHNSSSYWLLFEWAGRDNKYPNKYVCMMSNGNGNHSCSIDVQRDLHDDDEDDEDDQGGGIFMDTDVFAISLCHALGDGAEHCRLLDDKYELVKNIKPNPPCCLTVHNSSQYHFSWKSGYEEHLPFYNKFDYLMYHLHCYQRGGREDDGGRVGDKKVISLNTDSRNLSVHADHFLPDTEYVFAVRSSPNQDVYKGQWSDWSPEVHWRTKPDETARTIVSGVDMRVIIPVCVVVPLLLFLCFAPGKKWKSAAFIPTPAPYFHTLYSDCQGDFKSWVVTPEKRADVPTVEETLQIDTLTECEEVHEEEDRHPLQHHYKVMKGSLYSNMSDRSSGSSLLGLPYAVSTTATLLASGSLLEDRTPSSGPGSPAGDSGCWLSSNWSFERDAPWYNNEYCTLNAFQQSHTAAAEQHGSSCDQTAASRDYQNERRQEAQSDI